MANLWYDEPKDESKEPYQHLRRQSKRVKTNKAKLDKHLLVPEDHENGGMLVSILCKVS